MPNLARTPVGPRHSPRLAKKTADPVVPMPTGDGSADPSGVATGAAAGGAGRGKGTKRGRHASGPSSMSLRSGKDKDGADGSGKSVSPTRQAPPPPFDPNPSVNPPNETKEQKEARLQEEIILIQSAKKMCTRRIKQANDLFIVYQDPNHTPSFFFVQTAKSCVEKLYECTEHVEQAYEAIISADFPNAQVYHNKLDEQLQQLAGPTNQLIKIINSVETALAETKYLRELKIAELKEGKKSTQQKQKQKRDTSDESDDISYKSAGSFNRYRESRKDQNKRRDRSNSGNSKDGDGGGSPPRGNSHLHTNRKDDKSGNAIVRKPNLALQPNKLSRDNTPVEFNIWLQAYEAYYTSSCMDLCSQTERLAYFKNCLEPGLIARIQNQLTNDTPILHTAKELELLEREKKECDPNFDMNDYEPPSDHELEDDGNEPPSAFQILRNEFLNEYPIFNRRLDFYRSCQSGGQSFSEWTQQLRRMGDECLLGELTVDSLYVLRYLTGIRNQKLCDELLKIKNPTVAKLDERIQQFEVSQRQFKGIQNSSGKTLAHNTQAKKKTFSPNATKPNHHKNKTPTSNTQHKTSNPNTSQNSTQKYYCYRCGHSDRNHNCKALQAVCKNCGKKGHFKGVCNARTKANQTQSGSRANNVSSSSSTNKPVSVNQVNIKADAAAATK